MNTIRYNTAKTLPLLLAGVLACVTGWTSSSPAVELSATRIQQQVVAHVQEKLQTQINPADQPFVSVEVMSIPSTSLSFPQDTDAHAIKISTESNLGDMYSERTIVRVHLESPQGTRRDLGVPVHITVQKPVWVAKNAVMAQQPLRLSDFVLQTKDVSYIYRYAVGEETKLGDYVARINLQPGEVLDNRKIVIPPDVTYNAEVRILINSNNGMTLTVPGVAMANGRIGETIRVRQSIYQQKYYSAKVIDKNRVLVEI